MIPVTTTTVCAATAALTGAGVLVWLNFNRLNGGVMNLEKHRKRDIARVQIEAAVEHFEAGNFICAITLAGAAEEILGMMVKATGQTNALESQKVATVAIYGLVWPKETTTPKRVVDTANSTRNELKHHDAGDDSSIEFDPRSDAEDMLERAIGNYFLLEQDQTPIMKRYLERQHVA